MDVHQEKEVKNPKSKYYFNEEILYFYHRFAFMKVVLPYFDSEWSFAQFRVPDTRTLVSFNTECLIVISYEGNYYLSSFDNVIGGECQMKKQIKFIATEEI